MFKRHPPNKQVSFEMKSSFEALIRWIKFCSPKKISKKAATKKSPSYKQVKTIKKKFEEETKHEKIER